MKMAPELTSVNVETVAFRLRHSRDCASNSWVWGSDSLTSSKSRSRGLTIIVRCQGCLYTEVQGLKDIICPFLTDVWGHQIARGLICMSMQPMGPVHAYWASWANSYQAIKQHIPFLHGHEAHELQCLLMQAKQAWIVKSKLERPVVIRCCAAKVRGLYSSFDSLFVQVDLAPLLQDFRCAPSQNNRWGL